MITIDCIGGPLDGKKHEISGLRVARWLLCIGEVYEQSQYWHIELRYELIGGKYYFMSDLPEAEFWLKHQIH